MTGPKWRDIFDRLSEREKDFVKEILRRRLEKEGRIIPEEALDKMAEKTVEEARATVQKKGKQTLRALKAGAKTFWEELKREAKEEDREGR